MDDFAKIIGALEGDVCMEPKCSYHLRNNLDDGDVLVTYVGRYAVVTAVTPEFEAWALSMLSSLLFESLFFGEQVAKPSKAPRAIETAIYLVGRDGALGDKETPKVVERMFSSAFKTYEPDTLIDQVESEARNQHDVGIVLATTDAL